MSIDAATFVVQRGSNKFSCTGSDLSTFVQDTDLLVAQSNGSSISVTGADLNGGAVPDDLLFIVQDGVQGFKSVTGSQVNALFDTPRPPGVYLQEGAIIDVLDYQYDDNAVVWQGKLLNKCTRNPVTSTCYVPVTSSLLTSPADGDGGYAWLLVLETAELETWDTYHNEPFASVVLPSKFEVIQGGTQPGFNSDTNYMYFKTPPNFPDSTQNCTLDLTRNGGPGWPLVTITE